MNIKAPLRLFASVASLCLLPVAEALARAPNGLPEPSVLSLGAAAAVAGIIAYRLRNKK